MKKNIRSTAKYLINELDLSPHPEGGYYKEVYRSDFTIQRPENFSKSKPTRHILTIIYYLLKNYDFSAWHKLNSDENWFFLTGSPLLIYILNPEDSTIEYKKLGNPLEDSKAYFQLTVPQKKWLAVELESKQTFCLASCTVAPGFEFEDFEFGEESELLQLAKTPQEKELIKKFSKY